MKFQQRKLAVALAHVLGGTALITGLPVAAQDIRVEVTGSHIKRIEVEGALPIQVITRAEIEREGIQTAQALVERLSVNSSIGGINLSGSEGGSLVGYQAASLRGLGAPRTLVLLNGRRLANTAFSGTAVDINSIPLSAIDRVEVLTDGASAIYGSDAIAGVINFILRQDLTGVEASAYYGDSEAGGGKTQRYNISGGWGDLTKDKFNLYGTIDYNKIDSIAASQRDFSKTAYLPNAPGGRFDRTSGNSIPGNVFIPGVGTRNPNNPECLPPYSFPTVASPRQCRFDYASVIDIVPPSESWNFYGSGRWQFSPDHQLFAEASYAKTESTARVSPSPISSATILSGDQVLTVPSSPYYPRAFAQQYGVDGQPLEVFWRGLELGPRTDFVTTEQTRVVGGLQGVLGGWDYSVAANWSESKSTTEWKAGWLTGSKLLPILNSGQINLFGFNTPQAIELMSTALILGEVYNAKGSMFEVDARASKEIWKLPAGSMALGAGVTFRREEYELNAGPEVRNADVPGLGGSISTVPNVDRNVWAVYGELNIPIVKNLEANVALRYDDYEGVGNTWNPKLSLRWQPVKEVLLRGAWGTGFRAPGLIELYQPNLYGATGDIYDDPLRCPSTGSPRDCNAQFTTQLGGNVDLEAEESTNWTVGVVWEPIPAFSFGAEYWSIKVKNAIGIPPEEPIFSDMVAGEAAGLIVRYAPTSGGCQNAGSPPLPCPVNYGIQNLINLTQIKTTGVDFTINARSQPTEYGSFFGAFQGTYVIKWDQQQLDGDTQHLIGTYAGGIAATVVGSGSTGAFPRWKHNLLLGWNYGPWSANVTQLYVHGYTEPAVTTPTRRVGDWTTWGLNGSYTGFKNWTFTVGVKNILDTDPPYTRQSQSFQVGYDPAIADPYGRFWFGSVKFAFK